MAQRDPERRKHQRYPLKLPVVITPRSPGWEKSEIQVVTRDVSAIGIFFYVSDWPLGECSLDFKMIFPPELTLTDVMRAECRGKVVRIESTEQRTGVAAKIETFSFS